MTIQTLNDNTGIKWLYNKLTTIQTLNVIHILNSIQALNDNTNTKWLYRHLMTIQILNIRHLIKYYTFKWILYNKTTIIHLI